MKRIIFLITAFAFIATVMPRASDASPTKTEKVYMQFEKSVAIDFAIPLEKQVVAQPFSLSVVQTDIANALLPDRPSEAWRRPNALQSYPADSYYLKRTQLLKQNSSGTYKQYRRYTPLE